MNKDLISTLAKKTDLTTQAENSSASSISKRPTLGELTAVLNQNKFDLTAVEKGLKTRNKVLFTTLITGIGATLATMSPIIPLGLILGGIPSAIFYKRKLTEKQTLLKTKITLQHIASHLHEEMDILTNAASKGDFKELAIGDIDEVSHLKIGTLTYEQKHLALMREQTILRIGLCAQHALAQRDVFNILTPEKTLSILAENCFEANHKDKIIDLYQSVTKICDTYQVDKSVLTSSCRRVYQNNLETAPNCDLETVQRRFLRRPVPHGCRSQRAIAAEENYQKGLSFIRDYIDTASKNVISLSANDERQAVLKKAQTQFSPK